jgi:hypothetical protein
MDVVVSIRQESPVGKTEQMPDDAGGERVRLTSAASAQPSNITISFAYNFGLPCHVSE